MKSAEVKVLLCGRCFRSLSGSKASYEVQLLSPIPTTPHRLDYVGSASSNLLWVAGVMETLQSEEEGKANFLIARQTGISC